MARLRRSEYQRRLTLRTLSLRMTPEDCISSDRLRRLSYFEQTRTNPSALGAGDAAQAPALRLGENETGALRRSAKARVVPPLLEIETVIEGELLAEGDVATRDDPDSAAPNLHPAIGRAGVIDQSRDITSDAAVNIVAGSEREDIHAVVLAALASRQPLRLSPLGFRLGDAFARVLDDLRAVGDGAKRVNAAPMDRRTAGGNPR